MNSQKSAPALDKRAIGSRIRCLIETQYPTVSQFARKAGFSQTTLYKILSGEVTPSPQTLAQLCRHLGCSVDFLLGVSCPESDPAEGFEAALMNINAFHSDWSRSQQLFLVFAVLGKLSDKEEKKLRIFLGLEKKDPTSQGP